MKKRYFIMILILFSALLIAGVLVKSLPRETSDTITAPQAYFCLRDNCTEVLFNYLSNSKKSIHCAFFELDIPKIIELLSEKSKSIEVKIVIDGDYQTDELKGPGVHYENKSSYMHNKFCIIDRTAVFTGSFNPNIGSAYKNDNNILIMSSKTLADNYESEFSELWNWTFGKGEVTKNQVINIGEIQYKNYFCPEDHCSTKVSLELSKAKSSIYFMIFSFTHKRVAQSLVIKKHEGLDVKGIMEKSQNSKYSVYNYLRYHDIEVNYDKNSYLMHHKVFIIDNETVITGSFNPSDNADKSNDENVIIVKDRTLAKKFVEEFNLLSN